MLKEFEKYLDYLLNIKHYSKKTISSYYFDLKSFDDYGNPNSLHSYGQKARRALSDSLDIIYDCLGASDEDSVLITANSTEGNNTVLKTILGEYQRNKTTP